MRIDLPENPDDLASVAARDTSEPTIPDTSEVPALPAESFETVQLRANDAREAMFYTVATGGDDPGVFYANIGDARTEYDSKRPERPFKAVDGFTNVDDILAEESPFLNAAVNSNLPAYEPAPEKIYTPEEAARAREEDRIGGFSWVDAVNETPKDYERFIYKAKELSNVEKAELHWKIGKLNQFIGLEYGRYLRGETLSPEELTRVEMVRQKRAELKDFLSDQPDSYGFGEAVESMPMTVGSLESGAKKAAVTAPAGAVVGAAVAGPPGALVGGKVGAAVGMGYGAFQYSGDVNAGLLYDELRQVRDADGNALPEDLCKEYADKVRYIDGALEVMEIALILPRAVLAPVTKAVATKLGLSKLRGVVRDYGFRQLVKVIGEKAAQRAATSRLAAAGTVYAETVVGETITETLQDTTDAIATEAAKKVATEEGKAIFEEKTLSDWITDTVESAAGNAKVMAWIGLLGGPAAVVNAFKETQPTREGRAAGKLVALPNNPYSPVYQHNIDTYLDAAPHIIENVDSLNGIADEVIKGSGALEVFPETAQHVQDLITGNELRETVSNRTEVLETLTTAFPQKPMTIQEAGAFLALSEAQANYSHTSVVEYLSAATNRVVVDDVKTRTKLGLSLAKADRNLTDETRNTAAEDRVAHSQSIRYTLADSAKLSGAMRESTAEGALSKIGNSFVQTLRADEKALLGEVVGTKDGQVNIEKLATGLAKSHDPKLDKIYMKATRWLTHVATAAKQGGFRVNGKLRAELGELANGTRAEIVRASVARKKVAVNSGRFVTEDVTRIIDPILKKWKGAPEVNVVDTVQDLPAHLMALVEAQFGKYTPVFGFFVSRGKNSGQVYLIARNFRSAEHVKETLAHEILGHYGIRRVFSDDAALTNFFDRLYFLKQTEIDAWVAKRERDIVLNNSKVPLLMMENLEDRRLAADEWFARAMEKPLRTQDSWMREAFNAFKILVQDALRKVGINIRLTDAELQSIMRKSLEKVTSKEKGTISFLTTEPQAKAQLRGSTELRVNKETKVPLHQAPPIKKRLREITGQIKVSDLVTEREALREGLRKAARDARTAFRTGKVEAKEEFLEEIREQRTKERNRKAAAAELRHHVSVFKKYQDYLKTLEKGFFKDDASVEALRELLEGVDLVRPREDTIARLEKTREWLNKSPDAVLPDYVKENLTRLDKTPIRNMTLDEIRSLRIAADHLVHLARLKRKLLNLKEAREWRQEVADAVGELKRKHQFDEGPRTTRKAMKAWWERFYKDTLNPAFGILFHPAVLIERIAGVADANGGIGIVYDTFIRSLEQGRAVQMNYARQAEEKYAKFLDSLGRQYKISNFRNWFNATDPRFTVAATTEHGDTQQISFTRGEYLSLLRHLNNEDNRTALYVGGFTLPSSATPMTVFKLTQPQWAELRSLATDAEKEVAYGSAIEELFEDQGRRLGEAFQAKNGYDMEVLEHYFPKDVAGIDEATFPMERLHGRLITFGAPSGMTINRIDSKKPLRIRPFEFVVAESIRKSGAYIGMELPLAHAARLLYDHQFEEAITNAYGRPLYLSIESALQDTAETRRQRTVGEGWMQKMRANLAAGVLGLKLSTAAKQYTGYFLFAPYVDKFEMAKAVSQLLPLKKFPEWLEKESTLFYERYKGYSRDMVDAMMRSAESQELYGKAKWYQGWKEMLRGDFSEFRRRATILSQWVDRKTVAAGMLAAFNTAMEHLGTGDYWDRTIRERVGLPGLDFDAYLKATGQASDWMTGPFADKVGYARQYAEWTLATTQPTFSPLHRSEISRGPAVVRSFFMFSDQTNAMLNMLLEALYSGDKRRIASVIPALLSNIGLEAVIDLTKRQLLAELAWTSRNAKDADDDDILKEFAKRCLSNAAQMVYIFGSVVEMALSGSPWVNSVLQTFSDAVIALIRMLESIGDDTFVERAVRAAEKVSTLGGIPARPIQEDAIYIGMLLEIAYSIFESRQETILEQQQTPPVTAEPVPLTKEEQSAVLDQILKFKQSGTSMPRLNEKPTTETDPFQFLRKQPNQ